MKQLSRNAKILITLWVIQSIIDMFFNTFLSSYFFHLTGNNLFPVAAFNFCGYIATTLGFRFLGTLIKSDKRIWVYRSGIVFNALLLITIICLKGQITSYIWILGILWGLAKALFFSPNNLITSQTVDKKQLVTFNGWLNVYMCVSQVVMPTVLGWLIEVNSFINATAFVLTLSIFQLFLSSAFKKNATYEKPFIFHKFCAVALKTPIVREMMFIEIFTGLIFMSLNLLVVFYIVNIFKSNLNLGLLTSAFALLTAVVSYLFGKCCSSRHFPAIFTITALLTFAGSAYFAIQTDEISFIVYNFIYASAVKLLQMTALVLIFQVSQSKPVSKGYQVEYFALRELFLGTGRVLSFGLIAFAAFTQKPEYIRCIIFFLGMCALFMSALCIKLYRKLDWS